LLKLIIPQDAPTAQILELVPLPLRLHLSKAIDSNLKLDAVQPALSDDGKQNADLHFAVIWNWYRNRNAVRASCLHDDMASLLPDLNEAVSAEDPAYIPA
jgi:hypothetical protein